MARKTKSAALKERIKNIGIVRLVIIALVAIAAAWGSFFLALSGVTRSKNPALALQAVANEPTALAGQADRLYFASPDSPPTAVRSLAMRSLRGQAINARALRLLGYYDLVHGEKADARILILEAAQLSRREPGAQLWLIDAAAMDQRVDDALRHYDILLKTKPDTQSVLFPKLMAAIEQPAIRKSLSPYIRAKQGWAENFVNFTISNGKNLPVIVDLLLESGGLSDRAAASTQNQLLLSRLANEGLFSDARRLFVSLPAADPEQLTNIDFVQSDATGRFGPMGWQVSDGTDYGADFSVPDKNSLPVLTIFASSSATGRVATKLLYMKPGTFSFRVSLKNINAKEGGFIRWQLRCPQIDTSRPIWMQDMIAANVQHMLTIPANCPVQYLDIIASGGRSPDGLEATIGKLSLERTR